MRPIYKNAQVPSGVGSGHRGLWFDRFCDRYPDQGKLGAEAKLVWIKTVVGSAGDRQAINTATNRLRRLCDSLGGETGAFAADWHFATGLGNPHPVENGFLWHPTLGVPYIPGAAVKGLVRAWVESWMDFGDEEQRLATLYRWFGSEDKDFQERCELRTGGFVPPSGDQKVDTEAGAFIFFDALPIGPVTLKPDVMTPHMDKWYAEGDQIEDVDREPQRVPADWHDPVPVPFLVADKPKFQFCIAPRGEAAARELPQVFAALQFALEYLGAGAKTATGYGRFQTDEAENGGIEKVRSDEARSNLPIDERLGAEVAALTDKLLAEILGKGRNDIKERLDCNAFLDKVAEVHGTLLQTWQDSKDKFQRRAYKTVFNRGEEV